MFPLSAGWSPSGLMPTGPAHGAIANVLCSAVRSSSGIQLGQIRSLGELLLDYWLSDSVETLTNMEGDDSP